MTGGAVRLTGSGLGCSTWPQCEPGSFTPVIVEEMGIHPFIEFGNRLLTFVLTIVAIGVAVGVWRSQRRLRWWGLVPLVGVIVQAVVGGITVLTGLNPVAVAPHFLISGLLVWQAVWLSLTYRKAPRRQGAPLKVLLVLLTVLTAVVTVLGVLTTGAGPHSGDADATDRLGLDPAAISRLHALSVWAFVLVVAFIVWKVRHDGVRKAWLVLVIITLAQGVIGYVQYFTGLPELLVGFHLAGAAALIAAASAAHYLLSTSRVENTQ